VDIDLLKTFLEVKNTRHFGRAAENLYLTQAAVSARIKQLETILGSQLFTRYRNNLQLTQTGERLISHAETIIHAWNLTKQDISVRKEHQLVMVLSSTIGLAELCFSQGISRIHQQLPSLSLRAEICDQESLIKRLMDRTIDLGFLYDPPKINELMSLQIGTADLVLVTNTSDVDLLSALNDYYVSVDWGIAFNVSLAKLFPELKPPVLHTSYSRTALDFLLHTSRNACAFLPRQLLHPYLEQQLFLVPDAPCLTRPVYAAYHQQNTHEKFIDRIIAISRGVINPAAC